MPVDTLQFKFLAKKKEKEKHSSEKYSSLSDCQRLLSRALKNHKLKVKTGTIK